MTRRWPVFHQRKAVEVGRPLPASSKVAMLLAMTLALFSGLVIAALPVAFALPAAGMAVVLLIFATIAVAPDLEVEPQRAPFILLCAAITLYFVWPRYVFLPIPGLPVKHPQRAAYLGLLLLTITLLWKCAPTRHRFLERITQLPWISASWFSLFGWMLLCAMFSKHRGTSVFTWILDFLTTCLLYPLALICLPTAKHAGRFIGWLLVAAVVVSLVAWPESLLRRNLFAAFGALDSVDPAMAMQILQEKARGGRYRAQSSFDHPLLFAEFLVVMLPFALGALVALRNRRWLSIACVLLITSGMVLSYSRVALAAGLIGSASFAVILVLRGLRGGGRNLMPIVLTLFAIPLAALAMVYAAGTVGALTEGRSAEEASSTASRVAMLYQGFALFEASPVVGYGPGQGASTLNFRNPAGVVTLDNYVLALGLEGGFPALLLYAFLILSVLTISMRTALRADPSPDLWWQLALPASLLAFTSVKFILGTGSNNLLLPLLLGLLALQYQFNLSGIHTRAIASHVR